MGEIALSGGEEEVEGASVKERKEDLGFGIAKTAVEFENFRAVSGDHHAAVEDASIIDASFVEGLEEGLEDLSDDCLTKGVGEDGSGGVGSHATRVGALVVIEDPFVILGGWEENAPFPIGQGMNGDFFALEEFFE
jgi:hypothetical protein